MAASGPVGGAVRAGRQLNDFIPETFAVAEALPDDGALRQVQRTERRRGLGRRRSTGEGFEEIPYTRLGQQIFLTLVALAIGFAAALIIFGVVSYPHASDIRALSPSEKPADTAKAYADARSAWVDEMTSLGQLFLFGSILPLLATVVGYLLGDKRSQSSTG